MPDPTCKFQFVNDGPNDVRLILEPEGAQFVLPAGQAVQVHLFGNDRPVEIKEATEENGQSYISFWPAAGAYELFFNGTNVWDLIEGTST